MSKRFIRTLGLIYCCFSVIHSAQAGTVICEGTVEDLRFHQPGLIGLRLSSMNDFMWICNINEPFNPPGASTISTSTCKTIYATLLAAKISKLTVQGVYFDGDQVPSSCSNVQAGGSVFIRHFIIK
jgi:hypothetical protein